MSKKISEKIENFAKENPKMAAISIACTANSILTMAFLVAAVQCSKQGANIATDIEKKETPKIEQQRAAAALPTGASVHQGASGNVVVPTGLTVT